MCLEKARQKVGVHDFKIRKGKKERRMFAKSKYVQRSSITLNEMEATHGKTIMDLERKK